MYYHGSFKDILLCHDITLPSTAKVTKVQCHDIVHCQSTESDRSSSPCSWANHCVSYLGSMQPQTGFETKGTPGMDALEANAMKGVGAAPQAQVMGVAPQAQVMGVSPQAQVTGVAQQQYVQPIQGQPIQGQVMGVAPQHVQPVVVQQQYVQSPVQGQCVQQQVPTTTVTPVPVQQQWMGRAPIQMASCPACQAPGAWTRVETRIGTGTRVIPRLKVVCVSDTDIWLVIVMLLGG